MNWIVLDILSLFSYKLTCVYIYIYIYIYMCVYVCMYICICVKSGGRSPSRIAADGSGECSPSSILYPVCYALSM